MVEVEGNGFRATVNADNVEWLEDNPRGGTSAPMVRLVTGDLVWYRDRDGKERPASIVKRHDDNFGPIFDIRLTDVKLSATNSSDMRESVLGRLRKRTGGSAGRISLTNFVDKNGGRIWWTNFIDRNGGQTFLKSLRHFCDILHSRYLHRFLDIVLHFTHQSYWTFVSRKFPIFGY